MEGELEILLDSRREKVERVNQFTLVGKILSTKSLNRRGVMGVLKNV